MHSNFVQNLRFLYSYKVYIGFPKDSIIMYHLVSSHHLSWYWTTITCHSTISVFLTWGYLEILLLKITFYRQYCNNLHICYICLHHSERINFMGNFHLRHVTLTKYTTFQKDWTPWYWILPYIYMTEVAFDRAR